MAARVQAVPHWYYIIVGCDWCGLKVKCDMVSGTERSGEATWSDEGCGVWHKLVVPHARIG